MITETDGYVDLIHYLTGQLPLFEQRKLPAGSANYTLRDVLEEQLSQHMMALFEQNDIDQDTRLDMVREADAIMYDLEEILSSVLNNHPSEQQEACIIEFVGLVKNLFDQRLNTKG